jgi:hypothetical protein
MKGKSIKNTNVNGLILLIPYCGGKNFYELPDWYDEEDEDYNFKDEYPLEGRHKDNYANLPVYIETTDQDLAMMAGYQACIQYIENPPLAKLKKEWKERGYSGTPDKPKVEIPVIKVPYDSYFKKYLCCSSMKDWKIYTPEEMIQNLRENDTYYILCCDACYDDLYEQLKDWVFKLFNLSLR